jgi:hypothetical protein
VALHETSGDFHCSRTWNFVNLHFHLNGTGPYREKTHSARYLGHFLQIVGTVVTCSSVLYSTIVICAVHSNYYLFIYGSPVDEPRSSERRVVRDVASCLVRLAGPRHGIDRIQLGSAGGQLSCRWTVSPVV